MNINWIFAAFLGASIVHMIEEYQFPGGFPDYMKHASPRFSPAITPKFAIVINGLQLVLCVVVMIVGDRNLLFSLSVAGLLLTNALMHLGGAIRTRRYVPGVLSGVAVYLPLALFAYGTFVAAGRVSASEVVTSGLLGLGYQAIPVIGLAVSSRPARKRTI